MKLAIVAVAALAFTTASPAQEAQIGFKSVPIGASLTTFTSAFPDHDCRSGDTCFYGVSSCSASVSAPMASIACRERNMWAGIAPTSITSYFSGGALERVAIFFGSNGFDAVVAAGVERYGPPNEDRASEVQTNAGAKLQNRTVTWVRGGNLLRITKYGSTVTTSFAHISTEEYWARAQEKDKERAKKAAKDM